MMCFNTNIGQTQLGSTFFSRMTVRYELTWTFKFSNCMKVRTVSGCIVWHFC